MRCLLILVPVLALTACSDVAETVNSDASVTAVHAETVKYFQTRNVQVGNFKQTVLGTQYKARVNGRMYDCRYLRSAVTCQPA